MDKLNDQSLLKKKNHNFFNKQILDYDTLQSMSSSLAELMIFEKINKSKVVYIKEKKIKKKDILYISIHQITLYIFRKAS